MIRSGYILNPYLHMNNNKIYRSTCFQCHASWGSCHCPDVKEDEGFEWEGVNIINPVVSECGRFFVDPVEYYGQAYLDWKAKRGGTK